MASIHVFMNNSILSLGKLLRDEIEHTHTHGFLQFTRIKVHVDQRSQREKRCVIIHLIINSSTFSGYKFEVRFSIYFQRN